MDSTNTRAKSRRAIAPQRRNGKARVAALLEAGAAVIAEKGYDAATMAEIAARAGAPIGSLYRFFPNKKILSDALIQRYVILINQSFDAIDRRVRQRPLEFMADAILDFKTNLLAETKVMLGLMDARSDWSAERREFRDLMRRRIAGTLKLYSPGLPAAVAGDVAIILLLNMKMMKALKLDKNIATGAGAVKELRLMNRLYLANRLGIVRSVTGSERQEPSEKLSP
jgi:AcrR family transcriptional regulator